MNSPDAADGSTAKAYLQIHFCVLLWGITAILGKLITLPSLPLSSDASSLLWPSLPWPSPSASPLP